MSSKKRKRCHTPWKPAYTRGQMREKLKEQEHIHKKFHQRRIPIVPYECRSCGAWHFTGNPNRKHF